jgi:predicted Kef-type K+ transport protein
VSPSIGLKMEEVIFFINVGMALHGVTTQNNNVILAAERTSNLPSNNILSFSLYAKLQGVSKVALPKSHI